VGQFDLTIIGAGIVGSAAAYFARARMPGWRVALLDRSVVGGGATLHSVGLDFPYGRSAAQKEIARESMRLFAGLRAEIPGLPIYDLPFFGVVSRENLRRVLGGFVLDGVHEADEAERRQLFGSYPELRLSGEQVLLAGCGASYGFPQRIAQTLVEKFKESGRNVCWEGVEVESLRAADGGYSLHTGDGRTIETRRVLVATGPWMLSGPGEEVSRGAGVRIKKVAAMHIDRPPRPQDPILFFFDEDAFLLPIHAAGRWLFSFTSQEWDCAPEISRLRISEEDRALALSILRRYCPSFVEHCNGGRVFCDAYTPERVPVVAASEGESNLVLAGACAGSGYRLAPGIAAAALKHFS
jgi:glycine/D-amino acid oxidase-like deaminating enzyme